MARALLTVVVLCCHSTGGMREVLANGTRSVNSCCVATRTPPIHTITGRVVATTQQL